ncbi:carboxylic ester hydrolase [Edaphobacter acidisoli]|uniref:Carboxylic ester hydrolase n=1 Tax=Edaphobacter acidisoli TaxID=2040573 RepID=A0A916W5U5_9BACT|nr:carboxylesterase family protein [Edaphobacter acidisoli]GGA69121.1 carboxylic ester hydrolase [Edaphobacter acidisoli]
MPNRSLKLFRDQLIYLLAPIAFVSLLTVPLARAQMTITTREGRVSGALSPDGSVEAFKGIPYAAPPVGALRWQPPQPPVAWQGVRKADHFSASCMQVIRGEHLPWTREFMAQYPISEDCLYLNVWTAAKRPAALRPVLVWIHGGGLVEGSAAPAVYNGEHLAGQGIVVVSINYRLGVLGFLSLPELTKESPHHASGDYGLEDIVAALNWVHQNIAAFGGDPSQVTIAGQSSGAAAVIYMTASPLAKGLFRGAIAESGAYISPPATTTLAAAEEQGTKLAASLGLHSLEQLRTLPAASLIAAQQKTRFRPDVDGWFLPDTISAIFARGKQNDVPTITGLNADEDSASSKYGKLTPAQFTQQAHERYGDQAAEFLKLYPSATPEQASLAQKASSRDDNRVAMYLWAANRAKTAKTPAYTYYFNHAIPWPGHPEFGAFHSAEIPYWFRNLDKLDRPFTPADRQLSREMSAYWLNFIRTGNPNGANLPHWRAYRGGSKTTMELGSKPGPIPVAGTEAFNFWQKIELKTEK